MTDLSRCSAQLMSVTSIEWKEKMDPVLKKRLIGAAVLWILTLIFLPMLLDRSEQETSLQTVEMALPDDPQLDQAFDDQPREQRSLIVESLNGETVLTSVPQVMESVIDQARSSIQTGPDELILPENPKSPAELPAKMIEKAAPVAQPPVKSSAPAEPVKKVIAKPPIKSTVTNKPAVELPAVKPQVAVAAPASQVWSVQVGSFNSKENAAALVKRLREKSFAAQLSSYKSGGNTVYRVRVGPENSREAAEKRQAQLQSQLGLTGRVISDP